MRLFVAAEVSPDLRARLIALQERLRAVPLSLRLVRPTAIHLTLRFIGEVEKDRLETIVTALAAPASAALPRFVLRAAGLGVFPQRGVPRVIWVDLQGDRDAATRLAEAVEAALVDCGHAPETRPFRPHLTVARVRGAKQGDWRGALARVTEDPLGELAVDRYHLYESQLGPGGAVYRQVATWELAGGADR
jgi:2'-5' RNA ligase